MKLHYYPDTDSLYIEFSDTPGVDTIEVSDGVNADIDSKGHTVGLDVDHASKRIDLSSLEARSLPVVSMKIA